MPSAPEDRSLEVAQLNERFQQQAIDEQIRQFDLIREDRAGLFDLEEDRFDASQALQNQLLTQDQARYLEAQGIDASRYAEAQARQDQLIGIDESRYQDKFGALQPFFDRAGGALDTLSSFGSAESQAARLDQIFESDIYDQIRDERTRSAQGQLAAGGLTRSGTALQEVSDISSELGLGMEGILANRTFQGASTIASGALQGASALGGGLGLSGAGSAGLGYSPGAIAPAGMGGLGALTGADQGSQQSAGITQGYGNIGTGYANAILAQQGNEAAHNQALWSAIAAGGSTAMLFSDARLKENIVKTGEIGPLSIYTWDWKPETDGTLIENAMTEGFLADEVKEIYPQHVHEIAGFDTIDYGGVGQELLKLDREREAA